jgi:hypothetical protein
MVMVVHSEYNDSTYENSFQYIIVYDMDGDELPPLKKTAKECREHWTTEYLPIPNTHHGHYGVPESNEPIGDVVIPLTIDVPEFYIKEN